MHRSRISRFRWIEPATLARCGWTGKRRGPRSGSQRKSSALRLLDAGGSFFSVFAGLNDGAEHFAATDHVLAGARFDIKNQEPAAIFGELRPRDYPRAHPDRFQMIHFNSGADGNRAGRKLGRDGSYRGVLHQRDHHRRGENRWELRIYGLNRVLKLDDPFDTGFEPDSRALFGRRSRART